MTLKKKTLLNWLNLYPVSKNKRKMKHQKKQNNIQTKDLKQKNEILSIFINFFFYNNNKKLINLICNKIKKINILNIK
jgi:hypothetical protein